MGGNHSPTSPIKAMGGWHSPSPLTVVAHEDEARQAGRCCEAGRAYKGGGGGGEGAVRSCVSAALCEGAQDARCRVKEKEAEFGQVCKENMGMGDGCRAAG